MRVLKLASLFTAIGSAITVTAWAQDTEKPVSHHIICIGNNSTCFSYHNPGSNVWRSKPGDWIYEDPYPNGLADHCPVGTTPTPNIFIFNPGSTTTGIGYKGCVACVDESGPEMLYEVPASAQTFTSYSDWQNACGGGIQ